MGAADEVDDVLLEQTCEGMLADVDTGERVRQTREETFR